MYKAITQTIRNKPVILALIISVLTYLLFFYKIFSPNYGFWGSDMVTQFYPVRVYLYDTILREHRFPFWSEKIFSGTPIYADMENSYLNPINIISILALGPMLSYKFLHFTSYLVGSLSLFYFLRRKSINILGFFVANTAFFFPFFMLNHQVHLTVMLITYVTPLHFLLLDLFVQHKKLKYIFLQTLALSSSIYWGHVQFTLIIGIGLALYAAAHIKLLKVKGFLIYFTIVGILTLAQTAPLLIPNYYLFRNSYRDGGISPLQGSLMPNAITTIIYPYIFNKWASYDGFLVGPRFTYTEIYNYVGISALLIALFAFIFTKRDNLYVFCYCTLVMFVLLAFLKYDPSKTIDKIVFIELFRYWQRSVFVASFGLAVMCARFISTPLEKINKNEMLIKIGLVSLPVIYLVLIATFADSAGKYAINTLNTYYATNLTKIVRSDAFTDWVVILSLAVVTCLGLVASRQYKGKLPLNLIFATALSLLVFADLFLFARDVLNYRIMSIVDSDAAPNIPESFDKKRIIVRANVTGMQYLYLKSWSPFGYSNFSKDNYMQLLNKSDLTNYKHVVDKKTDTLKDVLPFRALGVVAVYKPKVEGNLTLMINQDQNTDLFPDINPDSSYVIKEEGHIVMNIKNNTLNTLTTVRSYLKSNEGWKLYVDGKESPINKADVFMSFELPKGDHKIEFIFTPYVFYYALLLFIVIEGLFVWKYKDIQKIVE